MVHTGCHVQQGRYSQQSVFNYLVEHRCAIRRRPNPATTSQLCYWIWNVLRY